jgi:hypothetical protein
MKTGCVRARLLFLGAAFACSGAASGFESAQFSSSIFHVSIAGASSLYELSDPVPLSSARWDVLSDSRRELSMGLLPGQEVRVSTLSRMSSWGASDPSLSAADPAWAFDPQRATYRYTFLEVSDWAWKVGVTTRLGDTDPVRAAALGPDRTRLGGLPQVHFGTEGKLAKNWLLTVDADGLVTMRGRALDVGVRVNYALTRSFYLFGGYRLSDHYFEGDDSSLGLSNSANVGVRYRF